MIRWPLASLAGASLALLLFWGLALLVAPPEADVEVRETAVTMRLVAAAEQPTQAPAAPSVAHVPSAPPAPRPVPPSPPAPAPLPGSALSLPEATLPEPPPPQPEEVAELDTALPELTEAAPDPEPAPSPESASPPATPEAAATPRPAASGQGAPRADGQARQTVQDVGQATPTRRVPPSYPRRAQRRGLEGHVVVEFLIRPDGRVKACSVRVVEARPRRVFDEAATRAVADWRFEADVRLRRARQRLEFQLR
ncbi:hypothetical protein BOX17_01310 [Halomonas aestuarii]|uniref:Protein TonB n=1 Tax=Halomonas aestuarii TaxID=1897729 RepID=A0A1J0VCJ6_9GAMM|nr:energy transducer TonB [Halomonas aestuarii]APE29714.1 hypothetical protein BOX17_01310 [Halomonas aestuarii]